MRDALGDYAPYISIFGLFLLGGAAAVTQVAEVPDAVAIGLAIAGVVLLLAWPVFRPGDLRAALGMRQARFGGNAVVLTLSVIGILVVLNFLGTRLYSVWDVTSNKRFSISRQTVQILDDLSERGERVRVTALLPSNDPQRADVERLLDGYRRVGDAVEYALVDPRGEPMAFGAIAQRIGEDPPAQGLLVEAVAPASAAPVGAAAPASRHAIGFTLDEQELTRLVLEATRLEKRQVKFTSGHEEFPLEAGAQGRGYSGMKAALEREGAEVTSVNLSLLTATLEADAVVVAGPRRRFQPEEEAALQAYVDGGGALMVLLDPQTDPGLDGLLASWGVTARNDVVLDPGRNYNQRPQFPAIVDDGYGFHTITRDLVAIDLVSVLPSARSLAVAPDAVPGATLTTILQTSPQAWGETNLTGAEDAPVGPDEADATGPLVLGVVGEGAAAPEAPDGAAPAAARAGRIVVFGSADMVSDGFFQELGQLQLLGISLGNGNLVLNAVNWLTQDEALISIRPTEPDDRPLTPPSNSFMLFLANLVLAPLAVAGIGIWIWWRRR